MTGVECAICARPQNILTSSFDAQNAQLCLPPPPPSLIEEPRNMMLIMIHISSTLSLLLFWPICREFALPHPLLVD